MSPQPPLDLTLDPAARVDLHLHTDRSDGRHSPEEVLRRAAKGGLDLIAITDHDLDPALPWGLVEAEGRPLRLIHGAEISGRYEDSELHLLVYFPGEMPTEFREFCRRQAALRAVRYDEARERIGLEGVPAADDEARAGARSLTRLHLAKALVAAGHASNVRQAFSRYTGDRHGTVPPVELGFLEAIAVARGAGGITAWAHPNLNQARKWTRTFAAAGLQGLEGYRPHLSRSQSRSLRRLAVKHGLFLSGGSDYHGWNPMRLGDFALDAQQARGFVEALAAA